MKKGLIWIAIGLALLWVILKVALAVTGLFLHLIWIAAVLVFVLWLISLFRK